MLPVSYVLQIKTIKQQGLSAPINLYVQVAALGGFSKS